MEYNPVIIQANNGNLIAIYGEQIEYLWKDLNGNLPIVSHASDYLQNSAPVDVLSIMQYEIPKQQVPPLSSMQDDPQIQNSATFAPIQSYYLTTDSMETQLDGTYWCAAYTTLLILRYLCNRNDITAYTLMVQQYGTMGFTSNTTYTNERNAGQIYRNIYPAFVNFALPLQAVCNQLQANNPLQLSGYRVTSGAEYGYHSFVLHGYDAYSNSYYVRNPWYGTYTILPANSTTITTQGTRTYTWYTTTYNW